jgi:S-formylglutathione hydrolase FrmB
MSVILSLIAVMVLKWVLGRYMLAARTYRSSVAAAHSAGYAEKSFATWNFNTGTVPSNGSMTMDTNYTVDYQTSGPGNTIRTFTITTKED